MKIKTTLKAALLALATIATQAQNQPTPGALPTPSTNLVVLTDQTRLTWFQNPEPPSFIAGYEVTLTTPAGTNVAATSFTNILVRQITTNLPSGPYQFSLRAVATNGLRSDPALLRVDVGVKPATPMQFKFEGTISGILTLQQ